MVFSSAVIGGRALAGNFRPVAGIDQRPLWSMSACQENVRGGFSARSCYSPGTSVPGTHPPAQTACPMAFIAAPPSGSEEHITCPMLLVTHSPGPVRTRPMPLTAAPLPGVSEQTTRPILFLAHPPRPVTTWPILFTAAPPPGGAQITSPILFFAQPPAFAEFISNGIAMASNAQRRIFI